MRYLKCDCDNVMTFEKRLTDSFIVCSFFHIILFVAEGCSNVCRFISLPLVIQFTCHNSQMTAINVMRIRKKDEEKYENLSLGMHCTEGVVTQWQNALFSLISL